VQTEAPPDAIDVKAEVAKLSDLIGKRDEAEVKMLGFLKELGYARLKDQWTRVGGECDVPRWLGPLQKGAMGVIGRTDLR
jgi:hypothetical protein